MTLDERTLVSKNYFASFKAAIFEPNSAVKMAIRSVLTELGINSRDVYSANNFSELQSIIREHAPQIVFMSDALEGNYFAQMVNCHRQVIPNRLQTLLIGFSSYNSMSTASAMAEDGMDLMMAKPFTPVQLKEKMVNWYAARMEPSLELVQLEGAGELINKGQLLEAAQALASFSASSAEGKERSCFLNGEILRLQGFNQEAKVSYERILSINPIHFFSLVHCFDLSFEQKDYAAALSYARRLLKNYPINPKRIEAFIRLAVVTHAYEDLLFYCTMVDAIKTSGEGVLRGLAAGLAVGAKHLSTLEGEMRDLKLIRQCLLQAVKIGQDYQKIMHSVASTYLDIGDLMQVEELVSKMMLGELKHDYGWRELQMSLLYRQGEYAKALMVGLNLLKDRHYPEEVFRISIKSAVRIDRNPDFIKELYQDGVRRYPTLESLLPLVRSL